MTLPRRGEIGAGYSVAGGIHECIDSQPTRPDLATEQFRRIGASQIAHHDVHATAVGALQSSRRLAQAILTPRGDDQIESVRRKYFGESGAYARGRTGNKCRP
jgi:hypothetical protein